MTTDDTTSAAAPPDDSTTDGRSFVIGSGVFLVLLAGVLLFVSPRLQDQLGLNAPRPFPTPPSPQSVQLDFTDQLRATAVWDAEGVCAEVTDSTGTTFRSCAIPDPLRPFWSIDAPDQAAEGFILISTPPEVASIEGVTTDGEVFAALIQARELPAGWALVPLPAGAVVDRILAFDSDASDVGDAVCGHEDAPTGGPDRLQGGCFVEQQD